MDFRMTLLWVIVLLDAMVLSCLSCLVSSFMPATDCGSVDVLFVWLMIDFGSLSFKALIWSFTEALTARILLLLCRSIPAVCPDMMCGSEMLRFGECSCETVGSREGVPEVKCLLEIGVTGEPFGSCGRLVLLESFGDSLYAALGVVC